MLERGVRGAAAGGFIKYKFQCLEKRDLFVPLFHELSKCFLVLKMLSNLDFG